MPTHSSHCSPLSYNAQGVGEPKSSVPSELEWVNLRVPVPVVHLAHLPPSPPSAFQDVFKLFSSSPTGTTDKRSRKLPSAMWVSS